MVLQFLPAASALEFQHRVSRRVSAITHNRFTRNLGRGKDFPPPPTPLHNCTSVDIVRGLTRYVNRRPTLVYLKIAV